VRASTKCTHFGIVERIVTREDFRPKLAANTPVS
jgi:hypothetical protein